MDWNRVAGLGLVLIEQIGHFLDGLIMAGVSRPENHLRSESESKLLNKR
jgi:hypothetical protein